jgi:DMSO/TMAO reductase YedYZ molybdopterin-dependent catalytic subunit
MNTKAIPAIALVIVAAIILTAVVFRIPLSGTGQETGAPTPLAQVEVRSYQGKDLSSVNDFRENSIAGPQHINISVYRLTVTGLTNRTLSYSYDQILAKFPHYSEVVTLFCDEGWDATILWEGVLVQGPIPGQTR